jgi:hypothetical protein
MTITLPPDLEQVLEKRAQQQGTTPEMLAIDSLTKTYMAQPESLSREGEETLADYWADYIGTIDTREVVPAGGSLSTDTGRKFAELMVAKYRKGQP